MPAPLPDPATLAEALVTGDRGALSRAITLAESTREDHQEVTAAILAAVTDRTGGSLRVGVTGAPGAGKSTLLDALGIRLLERGARVAVLAVDPTSARSHGSILGDKTRMERLAVHPQAFVRPTPSRGSLGGVAQGTRAAVSLCEAAGYTHVFVETVGVGQSETAVRALTDLFMLLVLPQGGDDLQGIKRGVMEMADLVVVHKADLDDAATREALRRYRSALHLLPPPENGLTPLALAVSSATGDGLDALTEALDTAETQLRASGAFERQRRMQRRQHLHEALHALLEARLRASPAVQQALPKLEAEVEAGRITPEVAAVHLLALWH
ncbi:MAG TPA: methylmalonyl Co-A mutase-associated GTPase MeaB [Rhodothermales bacterium]|nr:methylmalonyl Co-A mutase-associated GTPase MeaB [Rhodothermales bacterium]